MLAAAALGLTGCNTMHLNPTAVDFGDSVSKAYASDTRLEGGARVVTFANGLVVRELIVTLDDGARRLAYAAVGGRSTHHNASFQVFAEGAERTRLVWIADLLPDEVAGPVGEMMEAGSRVMKRTLEAVQSRA